MAGLDISMFNPATIPVKPVAPAPVAPVPLTPEQAAMAEVAQIAVDPAAVRETNMGIARGNQAVLQNQMLADSQTLSGPAFDAKYGAGGSELMGEVESEQKDQLGSGRIDRTGGEIAADTALGITNGVVQSVGGIAALAAMPIPGAAENIAKSLDGFSSGVNDLQSEPMKVAKAADTVRSALDVRENNLIFDRNSADDDTLIKSLGTLGEAFIRSAGSGASRLIDSPEMLNEGLAQGVGSLITAGPVGKGLAVGGNLASRALGRAGVMTAERATPLAIGLMEGGSSATGAITEVMGMSNEDLEANSPLYNELIADGYTPEDAKSFTANRAGQIAAAIQGPLAAVTGRIVSKFEAAPLASKSFKEMGENILKETLEEGVQTGSGTLAGDVAIKATGDENTRIGENLGAEIVQGAVFGAGTAGIVQAPTVPAAAVNAGKAAVGGVISAAGGALTNAREKAAEVDATNAANSGVTQADVAASAKKAEAALPVVAEAIKANIEKLTPEQKADIGADDIVDRVASGMAFSEKDVDALGSETAKAVREHPGGAPASRMDLLETTMLVAMDETAPTNVRASAAMYIQKEFDRINRLLDEDLSPANNPTIDPESDAYLEIVSYRQGLEQLQQSEPVQKALTFGQENPVDIAPTAEVTPQDQANMMAAATSDPMSMTAQTAARFLEQSEDMTNAMTPADRAIARSTAFMHELRGTHQKAIETSGVAPAPVEATGPSDQTAFNSLTVSNELMKPVNDPKRPWMKSLPQHVGAVNDAAKGNSKARTTKALLDLGRFAADRRNRYRAMIQSYRGDNQEVEYQGVGAWGKWNPVKSKAFARKGNPNSEAAIRNALADANAVMEAYNMLANEMGDLLGIVPEQRTFPLLAIPAELNVPFKAPVPKDPEPDTNTDEDTDADVDTETEAELARKNEEARKRREAQFDAEFDDAPGTNEENQTPAEVVSSLEKAFPNLVKMNTKGGLMNRFIQAFKMRKEMSPLLKLVNPMATFIAGLTVVDKDDTGFQTSEDNLNALIEYTKLGHDMVHAKSGPSLHKRLVDFTRDTMDRAGKQDRRWKWMKDGGDLTALEEGKATAIMETVDKVTQFNPALAETAMMAALDWFSSRQNREVRTSAEDVSRMTGIPIDDVTEDLVNEMNKGVAFSQARRALADNIVEFWGLGKNGDASLTYVAGIPEALAGEILHVMIARDWIDIGTLILPNGKEHLQLRFNGKSENAIHIQNLLRDMGAARKLIESTAVPERDRVGSTYINPPKNQAKTQLRNKIIENTKVQRKALKKAESVRYNYYRTSHEMMKAMGVDGQIQLAGSRVIDKGGSKTRMNVVDRRSVEGRNLTISFAMEQLDIQLKDLMDHLPEGVSPDDVDKFYQANYTRVNRLQFIGLVNPQSDKNARHVYLASRGAIDMSKETAGDAVLFWLAAAQGLGAKAQEFTREQNMEWVRSKLLDPEYGTAEDPSFLPLVQLLQKWMKDGKPEGGLNAFVKKAMELSPSGFTEHAQMSLLSVAEYMNALDDGSDLTKFVTHNYFEADGITNGAANALMNLSMGASESLLDALNKVGAFIGKPAHNMAVWAQEKGLDGKRLNTDLYNTASKMTTDFAAMTTESLTKDAGEIHTALFRLISAMDMKIEPNEKGDIVISRKSIKNPFTITMYRSGALGIAGNVTNEFLGQFYKEITNHLQDPTAEFGDRLIVHGKPYTAEELWTDLNLITNRTAVIKEDKVTGLPYWSVKGNRVPTKLPTDETLERFELDKKAFGRLRTNIKSMLVDDMVKGINATVMQHINDPIDLIQKTTNAQSIILHHMVRRDIFKALAMRQIKPEDYPDWKPGEFISQNELDEIMKRNLALGAQFKTKFQSFFVGTGERNDMLRHEELVFDEETGNETIKETYTKKITVKDADGKDVEYSVTTPRIFASTMTRDLSSPAHTFTAGKAGVAGVPVFTIGTGDGRAIDIFLTQEVRDKVEQAVVIFDGINFGLKDIIKGSEQANRAVAQTWTENPITAIVESFDNFMRQDAVARMFDGNDPFNFEEHAIRKALTQNALGIRRVDEDALHSPAMIQEQFVNWQGRLRDASLMIQARINIFKRVPSAVDQMGGASAPYVTDGDIEIPEGATNAQISAILEPFIQAEYYRLANEANAQSGIAKPMEGLAELISSKSVVNVDTGASVTSMDGMEAVRQAINSKLSNTNKEMMAAALKVLESSGYRLVTGAPSQIKHYEELYSPDTLSEDKPYLGKIDTLNKIIYISNASPETLVHELIHAATLTKMRAYFNKDANVTQADKDAIERLIGLKNQWMGLSFDNDVEGVRNAHGAAQGIVSLMTRKGQHAEALNEFLAWSMSNQKLINVMKKTIVVNEKYTTISIIKDTLTALKNLIWGHKKAPEIGLDMFSQVRFNARVLMSTPTASEMLAHNFRQQALYQSTEFGTNDRLTAARVRIQAKLDEFSMTSVSNDPIVEAIKKQGRDDLIRAMTTRMSMVVNKMSAPFKLDMQQQTTMQMYMTMFAVSQKLDESSNNRLQEIYDGVMSVLTPEHFMEDRTADSTSANYSADLSQAKLKFDAVAGIDITKVDKQGRSSLLPAFVALAMVNEDLRKVLRDIKLPKNINTEKLTVDSVIDRIGNGFVDGLNMLAAKDVKQRRDLLGSMDMLVESLTNIVSDERTFIMQMVSDTMDYGDGLMRKYIDKVSKVGIEYAKTLKGPFGEKAGKALTLIAEAATPEGAARQGDAATQLANQAGIKQGVREGIVEIVGRTKTNAPIFDMITKTRTFIDQVRQEWREKFPRMLRKQFKKPLSKDQWKHLYQVAKADVGALFQHYASTQAEEFLSSGSKRKAEIARLKEVIGNNQAITKAEQLANYMVTGERGVLLERSAYTIAGRANIMSTTNVSNLEALISLQAYEAISEKAQTTVSDLLKSEKDGMTIVFANLKAARNIELDKDVDGLARANAIQGHINGVPKKGVSVILADKRHHQALLGMSHVFMGDYEGSNADGSLSKMGYYYSPVSGQSTFNQGTIRTVRPTYFGVDPDTGYTAGEPNAGRITNRAEVKYITDNVKRYGKTLENLQPIFDANFDIIAYERTADPKFLAMRDQSEDLAEAMGAWRGRQTEEMAAEAVNDDIINRLYKIAHKGRVDGIMNEFVAVDRSTDPVIRDAWNNVPPRAKKKIMDTFGKEGFLVQRSMVNDVLGARSASISDMWTGLSRYSKQQQEDIRSVIMAVGGNKAYRALVTAEGMVQNLVTEAKVIIVIKSGVVFIANILSNINQLSNAGVPWPKIIGGLIKKTGSLNSYMKNRNKEMQLQGQLLLAQNRNDLNEANRLNARIRTLQDAYKRTTIHPLIDAGEFGAVSEGLDDVGMDVIGGNFDGVIDDIVAKIPKGMQTVARYALITKDTSLFKALSRGTQYGDFLGKSVLYDHLVENKKKTSEEAIAFINEEFVNFNRFPGRGRDYLESMGMSWFMNFKIRSMKVGQRMLHNNPFRALLHMVFAPSIPGLGSIGSPLTDSLGNVIVDGRIWNAIGPGQMFRSVGLHPVLGQLFD